MAEISASKVMELRGRTGLGMMECKKALQETGGDIAKAEDLLRIRSGAKASKAAARVAAEGVIGGAVAADHRTGALLELNCETDFVARNADFMALAKQVAHAVVDSNPADVQSLLALPFGSGTVESARQALVQKLGENVSIRRFARNATPVRIVQYLHGGRIGVMVAIEGDAETGKDIAMHIAASVANVRPLCVSRDQVPAELVDKERAIFAAQAAESGKPADIIAKMVEGRIGKYLAEVTLLGQPFARDPDQTVEKYLKAKNAKVLAFTLYVVGEGIEKRKDDFAAEVAAMARG